MHDKCLSFFFHFLHLFFFNGLVDAEFCRGTETKLERCLCNNNTCTYVLMYGEIKKKSTELILKSCLDFLLAQLLLIFVAALMLH